MGLLELGIGAAVAGGLGQGAAGFANAGATKDAAQANLEAQRQARQDALAAAMPTAGELAAQQKQIDFSNQMIARQEKLLAAIDPAIIESGKQALALLKGQEAGVLNPLRQEQARAKSTLENKLRSQLGSGFETSSAGIEALARFQSGAEGQLAGAQSQSLGQLMGFATANKPNEALMAQLSGTESNILGQNRRDRANAIAGTPVGNQGMVNAAGAQASAQAFGQAFGGISSLASQAAGYTLGQQSLANQSQALQNQASIFGAMGGGASKPFSGGGNWNPFGSMTG